MGSGAKFQAAPRSHWIYLGSRHRPHTRPTGRAPGRFATTSCQTGSCNGVAALRGGAGLRLGRAARSCYLAASSLPPRPEERQPSTGSICPRRRGSVLYLTMGTAVPDMYIFRMYRPPIQAGAA